MITAITSNQTVLPGGTRKATVIISDGKILEVNEENPPGNIPVTELNDLVLMPGIIDPHVHINEPGRTDWEGFDTATRAAIAGGVTTLVDMPLNASPVTTTAKAFDEKIASTAGKLHCNCGFWGGVIPGNEKEIPLLIRKGVAGFKAFLTHSGIDEFPNVTEEDLRKVMPVIAESGLPLLVHCELDGAERSDGVTDPQSYQQYLRSRPDSWELNAIALMIRLCEEFKCRTHIVHLSSAAALPLISRAKEKHLPLSVETAQHYLYFSAEKIPDGRTEYKCAPPIRDTANQAQLWKALKDGLIDFVATDHSPAPPGMKDPASGDLFRAWGGIASIQFALPALWTAARKQDCQPADMAKWLCAKPALLPGLAACKGKIQPGYDADLVAWDPGASFVVKEENILHRHSITPYLGETLFGKVAQSWLTGEKLFADGKILHLNKGRIIYHE
jgi:allantoinase